MTDNLALKDYQRYRLKSLICLVGAVAGLVVFFLVLAARTRDPALQVRWNAREWHFGPYKTRQVNLVAAVPSNVPLGGFAYVTNGYRIGPLSVFKTGTEIEPQSVGTNAIHAGDALFDSKTRRQIGQAVRVEKHRFEDGSVRDGVLVQWLGKKGEEWIARTNLDNASFSPFRLKI